ncbi:MAG TPA: cobalamin-binding protein [Rhodocyclaceae bacterium]|jgi:iron complex transport system substrate-binding protein|nr:cobalamin-binding protein [Rhodocyclaceae bacterium]
MPRILRYLPLLGLLCCQSARADIVLRDDTQAEVRLQAPAKRIISLAPHITELVYAAGAGDKLVGTVEFSNYPPAAEKLPRVGGYSRLDVEAIAALKPDLILAWESGNAPANLAQLRKLKIPVFVSQPDHIADIARDLERYGELAGTRDISTAAATKFRQRHAALQKQYANRRPVRVFYQVWDQPLMTINGHQIISDVIQLCGGQNIYANLAALAPTVSVESVLSEDPEAIVAGGMGEKSPAWLEQWRHWPRLTATTKGNLFFVDPNLLQRHTPRLLDGAELLCQQLEQARKR